MPIRTLAFACLAMFATVAVADEYGDARAELVAAYRAADFDAMERAAERALGARPRYPGALFNLALAQVLNSKADASLTTLEALCAMDVDFGVEDLDEFGPVRALAAWQGLADCLDNLRQPVGDADVAVALDLDGFVPEGIAMDADGRFYLGSIHTGRLIRATPSVATLSERAGHWSVFGMRFHPDGSLWFASAAVPQLREVGTDDGRTGLFRFDPGAGRVTHAYELARSDTAQVLGDLVIADADTLYATDSLTGAVYRFRIGAGRFETLVPPGTLVSPQGLVLDEHGESLYVADYIHGIHRISLADGTLRRVVVPASITDAGIDGLYRHGNSLIAIQNGVRPHRVVALRLDEQGDAIVERRVLAANLADFDEPTLGFVRDATFYFVANSHWNRFDGDNALPDGLSGPIVLAVPLEASISGLTR